MRCQALKRPVAAVMPYWTSIQRGDPGFVVPSSRQARLLNRRLIVEDEQCSCIDIGAGPRDNRRNRRTWHISYWTPSRSVALANLAETGLCGRALEECSLRP